MDTATTTETPAAFHSRIYKRNIRHTSESGSFRERYGKYLLKEYLEKEITKKESIAAELKQSIKEIESEELSGKERGNIAKRQRRYQEIQKEIRDMRKAIG